MTDTDSKSQSNAPSPLSYLRDYAGSHPREYAVLAAAIALTATISIIMSYGITLESSIPYIVYIVVASVTLGVVTYFINSALIVMLLSYFLAALLVGWVGSGIASKIYPEDDRLRCLVYFWIDCRTLTDRAAIIEKQALPGPPSVPQSVPSLPPSDVKPAQTQVFVQFAGAIARSDVKQMMSGLKATGWNVQGVDGGGERTTRAIGLSVVRYPDPGSAEAAKLLAAQVDKARVGRSGVTTELNKAVKPGTLEVWISN